jgi:hypothetical protein
MNGVSTGPVYQTTLYAYDPVANTYTAKAPNTLGVWNHSALYAGGKVYKIGGTNSAGTQVANLEIYDVASNTWTAGASMPAGKGFAAAFVQGNFIYMAGGISAGVGSAVVYRYDITANTWSTLANMPATRWGAASAFYGDSGVAVGGYVGGDAAGNVSKTALYYNAGSDTWTAIPDMTSERSRMAGAVRGGSFYAVGGRLINDTTFNGSNINQKLTCAFAPIVIVGAGSSITTEGCAPPNMALDPGESVTVSFCAQNVGTSNTVNLVGTLQATGGVTNPGPAQTYGVLTGGGPAVCRNFTFTVDPNATCGGQIIATIHFNDGATDLGNVTYNFTTGVVQVNTFFTENFDSVVPPALPAMWTATQGTNTAGAPMWVSSNSGVPTPVADTAPNAVFSQDPANLCDNRLDTPSITYPSGAQLMFKQNYDLEMSSATVAYDAGVLELSSDGGTTWVDILAAGGTFAQGGYNHTSVSTGFANPLLADHCPGGTCGNWSGISTGGFETCVVNLPNALAGSNVKFRFRMGSDNSVSHNGWRVDTVKILTSQRICCSSNVPTISTAQSVKTHGAAGDFGIDLPLSGTSGVECRTGGATNDFTIKVTFTGNVTVTGSPQAQVISGMGTIGTGGVSNGGMVTVMGNMVLIPLTNVTDQQVITVKLNGVSSAADEPATDFTIPMGRLVGDTNGNRAVNASDITQTKGRIGQTVTSANFRSDVNANGAINAGDASLVKANSGHSVP